MVAGCYPLEALLQSTLQCFYDQQCINSNGTFKALNYPSVQSRFYINSTIEFILQELMLEDYSKNISYENYFTQCSPMSCIYLYYENPKAVNIITFVLGLYSGVAIILQWFASLISILYRRRMQPIHPQIQ